MPSVETMRALLWDGWIAVPGTRLRVEDEKKALELTGVFDEVARAFAGKVTAGPLHVVDAAAGKGYVGLLLAKLPETRANREVHVTLVERDPRRVALIEKAANALAIAASAIDVHVADVADETVWPAAPHLVVSLHACGDATDLVIARAAAARAKTILVAPCCVASSLPSSKRAAARAESSGLGELPEARRRFIEAEVLAVRALTLEAAGYRVESVAFAKPTTTPYNVLLRAKWAPDAHRSARAKAVLARL